MPGSLSPFGPKSAQYWTSPVACEKKFITCDNLFAFFGSDPQFVPTLFRGQG
jgi:hypothetical protein